MSNLGMDIAASEFFKNGKYDLDFKNPETKESDWIDSDALLEMYKVILNYHCVQVGSCMYFRDLSRIILWCLLRILLTRTIGQVMPSSLQRPRFRF